MDYSKLKNYEKTIVNSFSCCWFCCVFKCTRKTGFGVTAGYINTTIKVSGDGMSASVDESGFFVGANADFKLSDVLHVQPAVLYASVDEADFLHIPIMFKYYVAEQFNIQAGPQGSLFLEDTEDTINSFGLDLGAGLGYDINENFFVEARYAFELTNRTPDFDAKTRINTLQIGVGYRF